MTVSFASPSALLEAVGTELGTSEWLRIDQSRVDAFAGATGDFQWIHVDPERAARGPFGATIAHGYLTVSLLPGFLEELLEVRGAALAVNAGSDRVRFVQPVVVGSRVRATAAIAAAQAARNGVRVAVHTVVEIEGQERPALVADVLAVFMDL
jgi:acyl dehydratase